MLLKSGSVVELESEGWLHGQTGKWEILLIYWCNPDLGSHQVVHFYVELKNLLVLSEWYLKINKRKSNYLNRIYFNYLLIFLKQWLIVWIYWPDLDGVWGNNWVDLLASTWPVTLRLWSTCTICQYNMTKREHMKQSCQE